jgi:hypothetical protein
MRKKILLCIGITILFPGVGIQPAIASDVSNSISNDEDDCDICPKVSKRHFAILRSLVERLEKRVNILSVLSKYNPKNIEKFEELSNQVSTFNKMFNKFTFEQYPIICITLFMILLSTFPILISVELLMGTFGVISFIIFLPIHLIIEGIIYCLLEILIVFNCEFDPVP